MAPVNVQADDSSRSRCVGGVRAAIVDVSSNGGGLASLSIISADASPIAVAYTETAIDAVTRAPGTVFLSSLERPFCPLAAFVTDVCNVDETRGEDDRRCSDKPHRQLADGTVRCSQDEVRAHLGSGRHMILHGNGPYLCLENGRASSCTRMNLDARERPARPKPGGANQDWLRQLMTTVEARFMT
jgi:hypothetical protein